MTPRDKKKTENACGLILTNLTVNKIVSTLKTQKQQRIVFLFWAVKAISD